MASLTTIFIFALFFCPMLGSALAESDSYLWYLFPKAGGRLYGYQKTTNDSFASDPLPNSLSIGREGGLVSLGVPAGEELALGDFAGGCFSDVSICPNFTVSFLLKINESLSENETVHVIHQMSSDGAQYQIQFTVSNNDSHTSGQATVARGNNKTEAIGILSELSFWMHVTVVYQGPGMLYLYINGTNTTHSVSTMDYMGMSPPVNMTLGSQNSSNRFFISILKIVQNSVNDTEIQQWNDNSFAEATNPTKAQVAFNQPSLVLSETDGMSEVLINRQGNLAVAFSLNFSVSLGSADSSNISISAPQALPNDEILFKPGETVKSLTVTVFDDITPEDNETATVILSSDDVVTNITGNTLMINITDNDIDECASGPCQNGGNCTDQIFDYTCTCVPGYTDKNCSTNIDECESGPCQNGGNCTDQIFDYTCTCAPGYTDKTCSTNIDECASGPCQNGGNCTDQIFDYTCTCAPGYTDKNCSTNIDECASGPCQNGGNCTDQIFDYTCTCVPGYTDKTCSTNIDECESGPCQNGGNCTDQIFDYTCTCVPGYTDKNCSTNIDECAHAPCQHNGTCTDLVNDYNCTCTPGYTGTNCSMDTYLWYLFPIGAMRVYGYEPATNTSFDSDDVPGDTSVESKEGLNSLHITTGNEVILGDFANPCLQDSSICDSFTISFLVYIDGPVTVQGNDVKVLYTKPSMMSRRGPYQVEFSVKKVNPADSIEGHVFAVGLNSTDLLERKGIFPGTDRWVHVAIVYSPGNVDLYMNSAAVTDQTTVHPWTDDAASVQLALGSQENQNGIFVSYLQIVNGTLSEQEIQQLEMESRTQATNPSMATVNMPQNSFVESEVSGNFTIPLVRTGNFLIASVLNVVSMDGTAQSGMDFQSPSDTVIKPGEESGAIVVNIIPDMELEINETFSLTVSSVDNVTLLTGGPNVDLTISDDIDECDPNPCLNGSTCEDRHLDYICFCALGFEGRNCSEDINDCLPVPCQNGGTCTDLLLNYTCTCAVGYTGRNCSINIDDCASSPCANNGTCNDLVNDYSCSCTPGYAGANCSDVAFLWYLFPSGGSPSRVYGYDSGVNQSFQSEQLPANVDVSIKNGVHGLCIPMESEVILGDFANQCLGNPSTCESFTISFLVYVDGPVRDGQYEHVLFSTPISQGQYHAQFTVTRTVAHLEGQAYIVGGNSTNLLEKKGTFPALNKWVHVAIVYSNSSELIDLYMDSSKVPSPLITRPWDVSASDVKLSLGSTNNTREICVSYLQVVKGRLSDLEIQQLEMESRAQATNPSQVEVGFTQENVSTDESGGTLKIPVARKGNLLVASVLTFSANDSNATSGSDYNIIGPEIVIKPGDKAGAVEISIEEDFLPESNETFVVMVSSSDNVTAISGGNVTVEILDNDINECNLTPAICQNNGNCTKLFPSYNCTCVHGFYGMNCENIDECADNPCMNGATCTDLHLNYTCTCSAGYEGRNCSEDINDCAINPCQNGGTCMDMLNDYNCTCAPGYMGKNCTDDVDECTSSPPCQNNGNCTNLVPDYNCTCVHGFIGKNCDNINECVMTPSVCQNNGNCTNLEPGYNCTCVHGFIGKNCKNIDECADNPCMNGANCTDMHLNYTCTCSAGYEGRNCSEDIDECRANNNTNPCENGGKCTDGVNDYNCACANGYEGKNCSQVATLEGGEDGGDDQTVKILFWACVAALIVTFVAIILGAIFLCYLFRRWG